MKYSVNQGSPSILIQGEGFLEGEDKVEERSRDLSVESYVEYHNFLFASSNFTQRIDFFSLTRHFVVSLSKSVWIILPPLPPVKIYEESEETSILHILLMWNSLLGLFLTF